MEVAVILAAAVREEVARMEAEVGEVVNSVVKSLAGIIAS